MKKTANRIAALAKGIVVHVGQGHAPVMLDPWDEKTAEIRVPSLNELQQAAWDGNERRKAVEEADVRDAGPGWDDVTTTEFVQVNGEWLRKV